MIEEHTQKIKIIFLNRFAELICKTIGESESTKIEILDCENFIVVKGSTSSKEILDLNQLKEKFLERFQSESENFKIGNTIDLIQYGVDVDGITKASFQFFNSTDLKSPNCAEDFVIPQLIYKSEFPFGYSYNQGKSLYYYAKHIAFNLQTKYNWDKLTICIPKENFEDELEIFVDTCDTSSQDLKSAILDSFEFNYSIFEKKLEKSDWWVSIGESLDPSVVKTLNEDFIIF